jgi:hypothetical protein
MKLRDLRYGGSPSWPPTWRRWTSSGAAPNAYAGTLVDVRRRPGGDGLIVERLHRDVSQEGLLLWEGAPDVAALLERLSRVLGRGITELEDLEI